jgi:hypothetical protein
MENIGFYFVGVCAGLMVFIIVNEYRYHQRQRWIRDIMDEWDNSSYPRQRRQHKYNHGRK